MQYIDFYLPSIGLCIEYDGIQHFQSSSFFGQTIEEQKSRDRRKDTFLYNHGIILLRFNYKDDLTQDFVFTMITGAMQ